MPVNNILIISVQNDPSTDDVMQWLFHFGHKVVRINDEDNTFSFRYYMDNTLESLCYNRKDWDNQ